MMIFLVLNGMAVVFLLYALKNFWKDGKRTTHGNVLSNKLQSLRGSKLNVFVATRPLELAGRRPKVAAVIRFYVPEGRALEAQTRGDAARLRAQSALGKFSSRGARR